MTALSTYGDVTQATLRWRAVLSLTVLVYEHTRALPQEELLPLLLRHSARQIARHALQAGEPGQRAAAHRALSSFELHRRAALQLGFLGRASAEELFSLALQVGRWL